MTNINITAGNNYPTGWTRQHSVRSHWMEQFVALPSSPLMAYIYIIRKCVAELEDIRRNTHGVD